MGRLGGSACLRVCPLELKLGRGQQECWLPVGGCIYKASSLKMWVGSGSVDALACHFSGGHDTCGLMKA